MSTAGWSKGSCKAKCRQVNQCCQPTALEHETTRRRLDVCWCIESAPVMVSVGSLSSLDCSLAKRAKQPVAWVLVGQALVFRVLVFRVLFGAGSAARRWCVPATAVCDRVDHRRDLGSPVRSTPIVKPLHPRALRPRSGPCHRRCERRSGRCRLLGKFFRILFLSKST